MIRNYNIKKIFICGVFVGHNRKKIFIYFCRRDHQKDFQQGIQ